MTLRRRFSPPSVSGPHPNPGLYVDLPPLPPPARTDRQRIVRALDLLRRVRPTLTPEMAVLVDDLTRVLTEGERDERRHLPGGNRAGAATNG